MVIEVRGQLEWFAAGVHTSLARSIQDGRDDHGRDEHEPERSLSYSSG